MMVTCNEKNIMKSSSRYYTPMYKDINNHHERRVTLTRVWCISSCNRACWLVWLPYYQYYYYCHHHHHHYHHRHHHHHCYFCHYCHYSDIRMGAAASQITSLTIVHWTVYSDADQTKHQSSASLAFVWGIHRGPVNSSHKWPVTRKMFPFDDVIMFHHNHGIFVF